MHIRNKVLVKTIAAAFSTNTLKMKFCANLSFMFQESANFTDRYQLASEAGFMAVESGFPFGCTIEQVKEAKEKAGVKQVLINLCTGNVGKGELGVTFKPGKEDEFRQNLLKTIEYAKALNCSKLHVMAGNTDEDRRQEHWTTYENNLKYASEQLKSAGLIGLIEPINKYSVPKYFLNSFDKAVEIIKRIDSPHLRLMLDVFHLQQIRGDVTHSIQELMPYVGHVQIAQVPKRNEPNSPGELNYRYVLNQLKENGYDGFVGLEYSPQKGTAEGLGWIEEFGYTRD